MLYATAAQTVGPYLHIGMTWLYTDTLAGAGVAGERFTIEGRLIAADAQPVNDGLIEIWQANAHGRYRHPEDKRELPLEESFHGFGRVPTDAQGRYRFHTVKPGRVPGPQGKLQAPHILVSVFARGILKRMATRIYFPGEPSNDEDPILQLVPAERRASLVAKPGGVGSLHFDIVLNSTSGLAETVFFDF